MKVLLTISSLSGGGAERVITWLADRLVTAGDSVCLMTQRDTSYDFYRLNPAVRRVVVGYGRYLDSSTFSVFVNMWRWRQGLRSVAHREQCDVVLSFMDTLNLSVLSAFLWTGIPVVVAERTDPRYTLLGFIGRMVRPFMYRTLARRVVVQTDAIAARVRAEWGIPSVAVIPNAVMIPLDGTLVVTDRRPCVLCVGRLSREKGQDLLLDAWSRVTGEFPDWRLRIVGEGPVRASLEAQIARLGLSSSVALPGMTNDIASEYRATSIFVLPSRFEGFPNALLEAMACGCAVIATRNAGASVELIQDGVNGALVPGEDVDALADELKQLMRDGQLRKGYAERATESAVRYSSDRIVPLWRQLLLEASA